MVNYDIYFNILLLTWGGFDPIIAWLEVQLLSIS